MRPDRNRERTETTRLGAIVFTNHCTVHPPSFSRRFALLLLVPPGMAPVTCGSSRSVSAPETAETAENEVMRDRRSDLSPPEIRLRCAPDERLSDAVTALRMLAEFGDVLVLEIDRGRSRSGAASPPFPRRRIECFRDTWRVG